MKMRDPVFEDYEPYSAEQVAEMTEAELRHVHYEQACLIKWRRLQIRYLKAQTPRAVRSISDKIRTSPPEVVGEMIECRYVYQGKHEVSFLPRRFLRWVGVAVDLSQLRVDPTDHQLRMLKVESPK